MAYQVLPFSIWWRPPVARLWVHPPYFTSVLLFFLVNRRHPYRWVTEVFWLNYLVMAADLWCFSALHLMKHTADSPLDSSALLHFHHAASHGFNSYMLVWLVLYSSSTEKMTSRGRISEWLYIYIYIYCHPQTDCFVVSQIFSVARSAKCFKLGSKPG